jgi:predicted O-methyltransferase YrrM
VTTPQPQSRSITGTVYATAEAVLRETDGYRRFRADGGGDFRALVDACAARLRAAGVPAGDISFVKRFPSSPVRMVERVLGDLVARGILATAVHDGKQLDAIEEKITRDFDHGPFKTFIYPEEGRLLGALAQIVRPRRTLFMGSYYGYWAHWAMPAIAAAGGQVDLVDPDERVCAVARRNIEAWGLGAVARVHTALGESFLAETRASYDFVVLDAEGPRDHPDPEQRGKRLYRSLTQACLPRMEPDALFVCHNILFHDGTGDDAFSDIIARNRDELGPFAELVGRAFGPFVEYETTEGVGIGRYTAPLGRIGTRWPSLSQL